MHTLPLRAGWLAAGLLAGMLLNLHALPLAAQAPVEFREVHLGMEVRIAVAAPPTPRLDSAVAAAFGEIARLEGILSDWRGDSELNRVVDRQGEWTAMSPELTAVLARALAVARASDGAFDPTIGRLTALWREERRTGTPPTDAARRAAHATVGWGRVRLDSLHHRVSLPRNGLRLDLGGIAKGWILDRARDTLRARGYRAVLLEAGGDVVLGEGPPGTSGWRVAVSTSAGDSVLVVQDLAMATSGPAAQAFTDGVGRRQSHVIDPRTARGLDRDTQVTVLGADAATTDAVATTLTLLPRSRWDAVLRRFGVQLVAVAGQEVGGASPPR